MELQNQLPKEKLTGSVPNARKSVKKKIFGYIAAGLSLVAGLAWQ